MDLSENILKTKTIIKEIEQLLANANPMNKAALFEPYTRLYATVGQGVIEADRVGNSINRTAESLVEAWFKDPHWENDL